ncbi:MAG: hypothetical protein ACYDBQ_07010 [Thermoplasmatota archaeon]
MSQAQALQAAVAALCMDEGALDAWAADPAGFARRWGLAGPGLRMLSGLHAQDVAYVAAQRRIDRSSQLCGLLPETMARISAAQARSYFKAHPYPRADAVQEAARFAKWCQRAVLDCMAPDLARLESALATLGRGRARRGGRRPGLARAVVVLELRHDVSGYGRGARKGHALHRATCLALVRTPAGVERYRLTGADRELALRARDGQEAQAGARHSGKVTGAHAAARLRLAAAGILAPG